MIPYESARHEMNERSGGLMGGGLFTALLVVLGPCADLHHEGQIVGREVGQQLGVEDRP
jgi:hypothetical protein